jgi:hypothetical protein
MSWLLFLEASALGVWIRESELGYPVVLISHTVGMALVVGSLLTLGLRVSFAKSGTALPWFTALFRVAWIGFAINSLSGLVLFCGSPRRYLANPAFQIKLAALAVAAICMWLLATRLKAATDHTVAATRGTRAIAAASVLLWCTVICAGRLIAYIRVSLPP